MINYIFQQFLFKWGFKYIINSVYDSSRSRSSQKLWSLHMSHNTDSIGKLIRIYYKEIYDGTYLLTLKYDG